MFTLLKVVLLCVIRLTMGQILHKYYASVLFGTTENKVEKWQRQAAKAANFGFPGGLGIETFIEFAKGYDLNINTEDAQRMKDTWFEAFPEMKTYMQGEEGFVTTLTGRMEEPIQHTVLRRIHPSRD